MLESALERAFIDEIVRRGRSAYALATRITAASAREQRSLRAALRRDAHTLRGSAAVLELDAAVELAIALEQVAAGEAIDLVELGAELERVVAELSARDPEDGASFAAAPPPTERSDLPRVLCVDDNRANLLLLERFFDRHGTATFLPATTGEEGLALALERPPDLVLLDLQLPGLSGFDVLERLAADPRTAEVPVVVVSADAHAAHVAQAQECGARDYLVKPVDLVQLGRVLDAYLASARP